MTSELVSVTFLIHVPLRSALKREAYRRDVRRPPSDVCRHGATRMGNLQEGFSR